MNSKLFYSILAAAACCAALFPPAAPAYSDRPLIALNTEGNRPTGNHYVNNKGEHAGNATTGNRNWKDHTNRGEGWGNKTTGNRNTNNRHRYGNRTSGNRNWHDHPH